MNRKTSNRTHKCSVGCHIFQLCVYAVWYSIEHLYIWLMSISINIYIHGIHSNLEKKKRYNYNIQDESKNQDNLCKSKELSAANRIVIVSLLLLPLLTPRKARLKELHGSVYPTPTVWFLCEQCAASPAHFPTSSLQPAASLPAGQQLTQASLALN